jgi:hypothetical protein
LTVEVVSPEKVATSAPEWLMPYGERHLLAGRGWSDCGASSSQNDSYLGVSLLHASGAFNAAAL